MRQQNTKAIVPLDLAVSCGGAYLKIARALLQKHSYLWFRAVISLVFYHMVRRCILAQNT